MLTEISPQETEALFDYCRRERPRLGRSLFEIALEEARKNEGTSTGGLGMATVSEVDVKVRELSGGFLTLTEKQWIDAYSNAEEKARKELLGGSSEQREADKYLAEADVARRKSDAKNLELQAVFREFLAIPERFYELQEIFTRIENEKGQLDPAGLKAAYLRLYETAFRHPEQEYGNQEQMLVSLMIVGPLRAEVLKKIEQETNGKLEVLKRRNAELAKRLNKPPHKL